MLCLALVLEGANRAEAAQICGMDRQTLRGWAHRTSNAGDFLDPFERSSHCRYNDSLPTGFRSDHACLTY
ncbi:MAG: helix-turn-helix domain-containing protein [Geminicoccaceae bacterium]